MNGALLFIKTWAREYLRLVTPYLVIMLIMAPQVLLAQTTTTQPLLTCPSADMVRNVIRTLSSLILLAVLLVVILLILFNMLGTVSQLVLELGHFFNTRIRFVFELIIIYVLFLLGMDKNLNDIIQGSGNACASVNYHALLTKGPLFFRIVGMILSMLGINY